MRVLIRVGDVQAIDVLDHAVRDFAQYHAAIEINIELEGNPDDEGAGHGRDDGKRAGQLDEYAGPKCVPPDFPWRQLIGHRVGLGISNRTAGHTYLVHHQIACSNARS